MKWPARLLLILAGGLLLAHYLPQGYWLLAASKRNRAPVLFYSCVKKEILVTRSTDAGMARMDLKGNTYERAEFERLLPLDNWMQLLRDGQLPETIDGVPLTNEKIRRERVNLRLRPSTFDLPTLPLYPLLEAQSGRVRLELPPDFMRFGAGVEFVHARSNAVLAEKSARYTAALKQAGFVFPARHIAGNSSTLKPYDEGLFLVDATGVVFQLRQIKGEPDIKRIPDVVPADQKANWQNLKVRHIHVEEQDSREIRAALLDEANKFYLIIGPDYLLVEIPFDRYEPARMTMTLRGDLFNKAFTLVSDDRIEAVVLDRAFNVVARHQEPLLSREATPAGRLAKSLFPFTVHFDDDSSGFYNVFFEWGARAALLVNLGLALAVALFFVLRGKWQPARAADVVLVALGGIYGVVLLCLLPSLTAD